MEISIVAQTVIAGVLVFVAGQLFLKLVIEPIHQFKRTMAEILHTFVQYAHAIHNPDVISTELRNEVYGKLRQLSGQLYADMELIPMYCVFGRMFFLPRKSDVYGGARHLIAIGNWMQSKNGGAFDHIVRNVQNACDRLGLYVSPEDRIPDELLKG
jgi:hypothetical protein